MTTIKCKECGGELSAKAHVCPKCGAQQKHPSFRIKAILLLAFIALAIIASFIGDKKSLGHSNVSSPAAPAASPKMGYALTPIESAVLDNLIINERSVFLSGGNSILFKDGPLPTFATDAAREYEENQVSADQKYYKKSLLVTGRILSINSGMGNEPYVVFKGISPFSSPQIHFNQPDVQRIASLKKGQKLSFVCEGEGAIIGTPMFKKCTFADDYAEERILSARSDIKKYLNGNDVRGESIPMLTMVAITIARELPKTSACPSNSEKCSAEIEASFNDKDVKQKMVAVSRELELLGIHVPNKTGK